MSAALKLDQFAPVDAARELSESTMLRRDAAREAAVQVVRGWEAQLQEALMGEHLRGLVAINGQAKPMLAAANVYGDARFGIDMFIPSDGGEALVLTKPGKLAIAWLDVPGDWTSWKTRPVDDEEIFADDLEPISRTFKQALERYVARAERTVKNYERMHQMAARFGQIFGIPIG